LGWRGFIDVGGLRAWRCVTFGVLVQGFVAVGEKQ
jgi:hypothetical protein